MFISAYIFHETLMFKTDINEKGYMASEETLHTSNAVGIPRHKTLN